MIRNKKSLEAVVERNNMSNGHILEGYDSIAFRCFNLYYKQTDRFFSKYMINIYKMFVHAEICIIIVLIFIRLI